MATVRNILTFDVEEYFNVTGFAGAVGEDEGRFPSRVAAQTERILKLLEEFDARATFFVLGSAVEARPELIAGIARRGHEVASHGFLHGLLYDRSPRAFREDLRRSRRLLEGVTGRPVLGFRAPTFSVTRESLWALPVLAEEGFLYDSSIVPVRHDRYGIPGARIHPFAMEMRGRRRLVELPPLTRRVLLSRVVAGGGGWFRLFPLWWTLSALRAANAAGQPAVLYFHPWEFDPEQPRIPGTSRGARFRHFVGMRRAEEKLRRLLSRASFTTAADWLGLEARAPSVAGAREESRTAARR